MSSGYREKWRLRVSGYQAAAARVSDLQVIDAMDLAIRTIAEQDAEIARIQAELDAYQGRTVMFCTEAQMDGVMLSCLDEPDGTVLRATDTGRELVLADHTWLPR